MHHCLKALAKLIVLSLTQPQKASEEYTGGNGTWDYEKVRRKQKLEVGKSGGRLSDIQPGDHITSWDTMWYNIQDL